MRKYYSLFLLMILCLNILGYYGVFVGMQYQNDQVMSQRLDAGRYATSFTFKIPITIPYANSASDYERVDGKFEHNGEFYRLVKQRLSQDTLFIVCVKDTKDKAIHAALSDFVKTFSDAPVKNPSSTKTAVTFIKDYLPGSFEIGHVCPGWERDAAIGSPLKNLIPAYASSVIHPPERA